MSKKITDLEVFALEQIVRPYQNMKWGEERQTKLPCSLDELVIMLEKNDEWSKCVLDRIHRIKFRFPRYVNHKLVILCDFRSSQKLQNFVNKNLIGDVHANGY